MNVQRENKTAMRRLSKIGLTRENYVKEMKYGLVDAVYSDNDYIEFHFGPGEDASTDDVDLMREFEVCRVAGVPVLLLSQKIEERDGGHYAVPPTACYYGETHDYGRSIIIGADDAFIDSWPTEVLYILLHEIAHLRQDDDGLLGDYMESDSKADEMEAAAHEYATDVLLGIGISKQTIYSTRYGGETKP